MRVLERRLYGLVLRMHPAAFRNEFGREMVLDFEDARGSLGAGALFWDALVSLARQWMTGGSTAQVERGTILRPSLLSGQYVMICQDEMTPLEFFRGLILSVAFLSLCGFAESHVQRSGVLLPLSPVSSRSVRSPRQDSVARVRSAGSEDAASTNGFDGRSDSNGRAWMLAAAVAPEMDMASSDGRTGATAMACGSSNGTRAYGSILHACGPMPSFEVVSIRQWKPAPSPPPPPPPADGSVPKRERFAPGRERPPTSPRVRMILPTELLITSAYGLPMGFEKRILNRPDWLGADQYEIQAKIEDAQFEAMQKMTPAQQRDQVALMEQSLLADRFRLKVHFETREVPVYALAIAKGGAKLAPAKEGESTRLSIIDVDQGWQMKAVGITLDQWITSPFLGGRMVVDQTGLKGAYDFTLTYARNQPVDSDGGQENGADAPPPMFTAVQQQLGLKLVQTKGTEEVIVIDHIERPSAN